MFDTTREYSNNNGSPVFRDVRSAFRYFKFHFRDDRPMDSYIRARRALCNQRGFSYAVLNGQGPGRASWMTVHPAGLLPE